MSLAAEAPEAAGTETELYLAFPPRPEFVRMARHTVAALARLHDVGDDVLDDLKLAVSEACTHAVTVNAPAGEPVRVLALVTDGSLVDAGPEIDPSLAVGEPELDSEEFTFERGLSLPLIRGLVDHIEIVARKPRGSVVRMRLSVAGPQD